MARRRKTGLADDLFELVAMRPWWVGVALALVAFVVLHGIAGQQLTVAGAPGQLGSAVAATLWRSLASVGQYALPISVWPLRWALRWPGANVWHWSPLSPRVRQRTHSTA